MPSTKPLHVPEAAVRLVVRRRHPLISGYNKQAKEGAITEAHDDLAAALPSLEEEWEKRVKGPAVELIAEILYRDCPDCGLPEPERTACSCATCQSMARRTKALRIAFSASLAVSDVDDWITCPTCEGEGEVDMERVGEKIVLDSGRTCPTCDGGMGFGDQIELDAALSKAKETPVAEEGR